MKVPPDVHKLKAASVVLTKLAPTDLPKGVTCNFQQQTASAVNDINNTRPDTTSTSVSEDPDDAISRSDVSCTVSYSEEESCGAISSSCEILDSTDSLQSDTASPNTLLIPCADRKMATPKRDWKYESTKTCISENLPYIESPRKRRKLHFTNSRKNYDANSQVLSDADIKEGNTTSNANEQASKSTGKQIGTKGSLNMPTVIEMSFGQSGHESRRPYIPYTKKKISDMVLGKAQHFNNPIKQISCKESHTSHSESVSKALSVKGFDNRVTKEVGHSTCNDNEQSSKSEACAVNTCDVSVKKPTLSRSGIIDCFNQPKTNKKSKFKIENITAKLMREKQEVGTFASTDSVVVNSSSYLSKIKRETLGTAEYTSIMPIDRRQSTDQTCHRARKRPAQKQYVRAGSAVNVSLKEELIPEERCSSVPSSSVNKLNETRKLLKTAISASALSTKIEYTTSEEWLQGTQKNFPNILVKSKFATKSKGSSKNEQASACSKSSTSDQMCTDSSESVSTELCRLQKTKHIVNPEMLTKIKPKRSKKKQAESLTDELVQPGPSGYRKLSGVVVEGTALTETQHKSVPFGDTGRISPKQDRKSNTVYINNPNAVPHMKELRLPIKGSQMKIMKTSPQKGKRVTLTYKNEIGSDSPISFNFSSKMQTSVPEETTEIVKSKSLASKSVSAVKPLVQMGSFAISKSQEIIPIKSSESFLTPNTKPNVITPKRVSHAISYADYCAQMDDVEASQDAANSKPRRKSESDVAKEPELQKNEEDICNNLKDQPRDDASSLLKKLDQLHVNNTKCSEDSESAEYSDTVDVLDCPEVVMKQEKDDDSIKIDIDDDDDTDSLHLSDHRYTKTPDASPAKTLTKDILHQTSTKSGTVAMINRKQTTEGEHKQPVYAVKYGNKLFLIHSKDKKNNGDAKPATSGPKKETSSFKPISPKIEIKTEKEQTLQDSPYLTKKKSIRKVNTGKLVSKRKMDFIKQLVLNQKYLKRKKKQEKQSVYSCRSNRTSVNRNAKVVYITRSGDTIQTTTSRVSITLTKGTDAKLKRWSRYADFRAQLTYHDEENTLTHIKVDELQPGFYKLMPASDMSDTRTITVILSCLPPHPDAITEGDSFIAVGPLRNVVDTGQDAKQTEGWSTSQLGRNLTSILPSTAMCHGSLYSSDVSYRPKMDAQEWYGAGVFDIFTRKYCRQKRVVQQRKWDKNPYDKAFH